MKISIAQIINKIKPRGHFGWFSIFAAAICFLCCSTVQISESRLKGNVLNGSMAEYEVAKKSDEVEILDQPCIDGNNCDKYESANLPVGKYRVAAKLPQRAFASLLNSAQLCSKEIELRNDYFFGQNSDRKKFSEAAEKATYQQNLDALNGFEKQMQFFCNCQNTEKGSPRKTACEVQIYDAKADSDRRRIIQFIDSMEKRLQLARKEDREKERIAREVEQKESEAVPEADRKRARKLAKKMLTVQYDFIYKAFLCRNDEPIEIVDIDKGEIIPCAEGLNQNTLQIETTTEYYFRVTLKCMRAGTNFVVENKAIFRTSRDGQRYGFTPYRTQQCEQGPY